MTGALDATLRPLAVELIAEYGKSITLTRVAASGSYDPATASISETSTPETIKAIVEDYKGYEFANGLILTGDKKLTVAASGLTAPNVGSTVTIDSVIFTIVSVKTEMSGELAALYYIQARK